LKIVDEVVVYNDNDGSSCDAIQLLKTHYPKDQIVFANGGDRTKDNIPEMVIDDVEFVFGVGGENKMNSSSWILEDWKKPRTTRAWGFYRVLHEVGPNTKLKELTVAPKTCLSMQRHDHRAEFWFVAEGKAADQWHMLCNETDQPLKLIEIQFGENCVEEDIERR